MMRTSLSLDQIRGLPGRARGVLAHLDDYATPIGAMAVSVGDVVASLGDAAARRYRELVVRGQRLATGDRPPVAPEFCPAALPSASHSTGLSAGMGTRA